ncbi:MAG TPA: zinc metallopeptidase [Erysipelotrichaceae bacterium]|mgnify:CR=1 FL=1|nr:zinc metallopeptidase [Erysipelotrichaceae bacterium]HQB31898.1 zinc metallopeptidase [Erysipelotrichaceae bacterium]
MEYYVFALILLVLSLGASYLVKSRFDKYVKYPVASNYNGSITANTILRSRNISDVQVISVPGTLTDHYNPSDKTLALSEDVFNISSIASVAVAAHECGHAIQHAEGYMPVIIRTKMVPVANFVSFFSYVAIFLGLAIDTLELADFGIILFSVIVLFHFITLPIEIDASRRALKLVDELGIYTQEEKSAGKKVLDAAALTYFVSLLTVLLTLLRYVLIVSSRRSGRSRR